MKSILPGTGRARPQRQGQRRNRQGRDCRRNTRGRCGHHLLFPPMQRNRIPRPRAHPRKPLPTRPWFLARRRIRRHQLLLKSLCRVRSNRGCLAPLRLGPTLRLVLLTTGRLGRLPSRPLHPLSPNFDRARRADLALRLSLHRNAEKSHFGGNRQYWPSPRLFWS